MSVSVITAEQARSWCGERGITLDNWGPTLSGSELRRLQFRIPEDAGARTALAGVLYPDTWGIKGQVLIWTTGWSVWASGEHMPLFVRLREALGDGRPLGEASAQVVDRDSVDDGKSLAIVNVLFLWDCWVIAEAFDYAVFFSHDEWGEVYARSDDTCQTALRYLRDMDLLT